MGKRSKKKSNNNSSEEYDNFYDSDRKEDEGEWEVVVDTKKKNYQQRIARKEAERRQELANQGIKVQDKSKPEESKDDSYKSSGMKSAPVLKRRTSSKKTAAFKKPSNEEELTNLVSSILSSAPTSYVQTSVIANRVQQLTNASWNKSFKKKFGTLPEFLKSNSRFHFDEKTNTVYLTESFEEVKEIERVVKEVKEAKKNNKPKKKKQNSSSSSDDSGSDDNKEAESPRCSLLGITAVFLLLTVCGGMTFVALQGGDMNTLREAVDQYLQRVLS